MSSEQSIQQFVHSVFSKKPEQKRIEWIACLNGEGYDCISELEEASQQAWKLLSEKLPIFVTDNIKKNLKQKSSHVPIPSDKSSSMIEYFWKMGMNSIQQFSKQIQNKNVLPLSLNQSSEVLQLRNFFLCESIKTSEEQIIQLWEELQISKKNLQYIKINKKKIQENGQYKRKVLKTQVKMIPLDNYYQICEICQVKCCQNCVWPQGASQSRCKYFSQGRGCPICPGNCPKSAHIRHNYLIKKVKTEREQIVNFKKELHDSGLTSAQFYNNLLNQNYQKIRNLSLSCWQKILKIKQDLKKLQSIVLKPQIFTNQQSYKKMLKQEEESKMKGWAYRVQVLQQIIKKIMFLGKVEKSLTMYDLIPGMEQFEKDYDKGKKFGNLSIF